MLHRYANVTFRARAADGETMQAWTGGYEVCSMNETRARRSRPHVTLYGRAGCHLCADMRAMLGRLAHELAFSIEEVDIDTDAALLTRYDVVVPVVMLDDKEIARAPIGEDTLERGLRQALGAP